MSLGWRRISRFLVLVILLTMIVVVMFVLNRFSLPNGRFQRVSLDGTDGEVIRDFSYALMQNDRALLQENVIQDSWSRVEQWTANHERVKCRNSLEDIISNLLDPAEHLRWSAVEEPGNGNEIRMRYDYVFYVPCRDRRDVGRRGYSLAVKDLIMVATPLGWKVDEFGCISAEFDYSAKPKEDLSCVMY